MTTDAHREFKNRLYGQFARIGKALSSPHRLELLELLAQGERTVDSLATEIGTVAREHLTASAGAAAGGPGRQPQGRACSFTIVSSMPRSSTCVEPFARVAEHQLAEFDRLVRDHFGDRSASRPYAMEELLKRARSRQVVILDTRPAHEYAGGAHCRRDLRAR